ncbi:MAG: winged helix-turn-helix domain-containing protein [Euryarchaeota archaeon]|nr:winged helix-turn-helix domain-containing protein [Euryarchaeota archaeon]
MLKKSKPILTAWMDNITLDKRTIRTLASETRVCILKTIDSWPVTLKDLTDELNNSKPTVHEHLTILIESGLVKKVNKNNKWVYYELAEEGKGILHSCKSPKRILILLSSSILAFVGGVLEVYRFVKNIFPTPAKGGGGMPVYEPEHLTIGLILFSLGFLFLYLLHRSIRGRSTGKAHF